MPDIKTSFMKRIMFSTLFIAGIFLSMSSFAAPVYGHGGWGGRGGYGYHGGYVVHAGFGFHTGVAYAAPRVFYPPVPVPVVYGPVYRVYPSYYGHAYYHRPYCRR
jgi:hypothetical protein